MHYWKITNFHALSKQYLSDKVHCGREELTVVVVTMVFQGSGSDLHNA